MQAKGEETKNTQKVRTGESLDVFSQRQLHSQAVHAQSSDVCYHLGLSLGRSEPRFYFLDCYLFISRLTNSLLVILTSSPYSDEIPQERAW